MRTLFKHILITGAFIASTLFAVNPAYSQANSGPGAQFVANNFALVNADTNENYATSASYGFEASYQFVIQPELTFVTRVGEQVGGVRNSNTERRDRNNYKIGYAAAEVRIWRRQFYIAAGYGRSALAYITNFQSYTNLRYAPIMTAALGLELDTGFSARFALAKTDKFTYDTTQENIMGTAFGVGYRWKL